MAINLWSSREASRVRATLQKTEPARLKALGETIDTSLVLCLLQSRKQTEEQLSGCFYKYLEGSVHS